MSKSQDLMKLKSITQAVRSYEGTVTALLQFICEQIIEVKEEIKKLETNK